MTVGGSEIVGVRDVAQYVLPAMFIAIGLILLFGRTHLRPPASDTERREEATNDN